MGNRDNCRRSHLFTSDFAFIYKQYSKQCLNNLVFVPTILDKTVEKIVYLDSIFLNIVAGPVFPSPPSPESNVVVYSKESLIPGRLWEATLNWRKGFSFRKGVVLEIVLLRRKVDMMGKTFSSSFVRDCSLKEKKKITADHALGSALQIGVVARH